MTCGRPKASRTKLFVRRNTSCCQLSLRNFPGRPSMQGITRPVPNAREKPHLMNKKLISAAPLAIPAALSLYACGGNEITQPDITSIKTVVVIYAENRSFDNLYGNFPGANGLQSVSSASATQVDRDGTPLATLPQVWNGLTQTGVTPVVTQAM